MILKSVNKMYKVKAITTEKIFIGKSTELLWTYLTLDEHKYISCKILPDSCRKYESSKILEKFICKILADDVNLARIPQKT